VPLPLALGRFNVRVTNRILWPIAGWIPGFGRVVHAGRRSGRTYRTPMFLFRSGDRGVFALTYGPDAQWVQNVLAAGSCRFEMRGRVLDMELDTLVNDPSRRFVPRPVRWALEILRADDFLVMRVTGEG
jgi:deazaflavin-dependent oxidoreductase (nitroreductase family)